MASSHWDIGGLWSVDTVEASRWAAAMVNIAAAVAAVRGKRHFRSVYGPHMVFVAFWTFMLGVGMLVLATGWDIPYVLEGLNIIAMCALGGWGTLIWRFSSSLRAERALLMEIAEVESERSVMKDLEERVEDER